MIRPLIIMITVFAFVGCKSTKQEKTRTPKSPVDWQVATSLSPVLDKASARDKLVFLDLYTDWCLPCKLMEQDVYSDQKIGDYLSDNFVCYKVNAEKANGPDLAFLFEVKAYPTLLWLNEKGRVVQRHEGAAYHAELTRLSEEAMRLKQEKI